MINHRTDESYVSEFNMTTTKLIKLLEKKSRSEAEIVNLDRLRQRLTLLRSTDREAPVRDSYPVFFEYQSKILDPIKANREEFFLNLDVRGEYIHKGNVIKPEDESIFSLIDSIKIHYTKCSEAEKNGIYEDVKKMLVCSIGYKRNHLAA